MAEKIVSPGVFTNEKDLSFLPAGVAQIGGAFVGAATKGPAFVPTALNSFTEFETIFGKTNANYYMPYAVKEYVTNGGRATVVRIMPSEGYALNNGIVAVYASSSLKTRTAVSNSLVATGLYTPTEVATYSANGSQLLFTLHPTKKQTDATYYAKTDPAELLSNGSCSYTLNAAPDFSSSISLTISGSGAAESTYTINGLIRTDNNYYTKVFGTTPMTSNDSVYLYNIFQSTYGGITPVNSISNFYTASVASGALGAGNALFVSMPSGTIAGTVTASVVFSGNRRIGASGQYHTYASTPWIISQTVNGVNNKLFKFHTMSEGTNANYEVKVGISNIRAAGTVPGTEYGDFTVVVRAVDQSLIPGSPFTTIDSDVRPTILETYTQCNLDPASKNFIGRKIGDKYRYFDTENLRAVVTGDYDNKSKYIRVEVDTKVTKGSYSTALVPFGFESLYATLPSHMYSGSHVDVNGTTRSLFNAFPIAKYKANQKDANNVYNKKVYFGFDYDFSTNDNLNYLKPVPNDATTTINKNFLLSNYTQDASAGSEISIDLTSATNIESRKFVVPFQFGFDGTYPNKELLTGANITATNTQGFNVNTSTSDGYLAFKYGIDAIGSATSVDINMLVCPGLIYLLHPAIISYAEQVAQDRGDTFFIFEATGLEATAQATVDAIQDWDSNYAATYYPWVKIVDANTTKPLWVPPSVVMPGVLAYNDKVGEQWFAPAGLNRGTLPNVVDAYSRLSRTEIDTLYDGRVNPIATLPGQGITVWGQKTLQAKPSALDRINVRRLLIALKKFIASATQYLVFEQNTSATRNRFLNIVNPYMESVQQRSGVYAFKVVMDDTNNTPDLIDRNIMYGQIYLQPTRTAEFIIIDFNILPTGATFGA